MVEAAETRVKIAEKDYSPDFTVTANYAARGGVEKDMWSLTTQINIPLYQQTKQREAVQEAEATLAAARYELEATKLGVSSAIQDSYAMLKADGKTDGPLPERADPEGIAGDRGRSFGICDRKGRGDHRDIETEGADRF